MSNDKRPNDYFDAKNYWDCRYYKGRSSGDGSKGELAIYKSSFINSFVKKHNVNSVIEFGCGDGSQLSLGCYPYYIGYDISPNAITICKRKFPNDQKKTFVYMMTTTVKELIFLYR